jgi:hypothetical protein
MLNDLRQSQFALARYLRDPVSAPLPKDVNAADASACAQAMADHVSAILTPAFPVTRAALGDEMWGLTVRLFIKDASCHVPWATEVQRAFVDHLCASAEVHQLPAWFKGVAQFEWLQTKASAKLLDEAPV